MNLTYDLAEGHNITLKGSMNMALPEGYDEDEFFLSLMQRAGENYGSIAGAKQSNQQ